MGKMPEAQNFLIPPRMCYILLFLFCYHAEKYNYSLADYIQKDGQLRFARKYMNSNILHEEILSYLFAISLYPKNSDT